jgi:hypothetical protein
MIRLPIRATEPIPCWVSQSVALGIQSPGLVLQGLLWVQIATNQYLFYPRFNSKSKLGLLRSGGVQPGDLKTFGTCCNKHETHGTRR